MKTKRKSSIIYMHQAVNNIKNINYLNLSNSQSSSSIMANAPSCRLGVSEFNSQLEDSDNLCLENKK